MKDNRKLSDLVSVGPATLRDFERLGIRTVADLARRSPEKLYERLCAVTGRAQDICCLDVFRAAVAQARDPRLPAAQRRWWYWSRQRLKAEQGKQKTKTAPSRSHFPVSLFRFLSSYEGRRPA